MKALRASLLIAALSGIGTAATAAPYRSFTDMEAQWQQLSSSNPAYQPARPQVNAPAADPIPRAVTPADRAARFQSEEQAWQEQSRSDSAPSGGQGGG